MNTAAPPLYAWNALPWKRCERQVFTRQQRIYRAARRGDTQAVHQRQRLLLTSRAARTLAVRQVTQDHRGVKQRYWLLRGFGAFAALGAA